MPTRKQKQRQTRRFRYAAGYVIEQEGTGVVERLVRDGTMTRFGVTENQYLGASLEELTRTDAEKLFRKKEWRFENYHEIDVFAVTVPTKIFDTQILFSRPVAVSKAQLALNDTGFDLDETGRLDPKTRRAISEVDPNTFFEKYIDRLELFVQGEHDGRQPLIARARNLPYKNVETSPTTI